MKNIIFALALLPAIIFSQSDKATLIEYSSVVPTHTPSATEVGIVIVQDSMIYVHEGGGTWKKVAPSSGGGGATPTPSLADVTAVGASTGTIITSSGGFVSSGTGRYTGGFGATTTTGSNDWLNAANLVSGSPSQLILSNGTNGPTTLSGRSHIFNFDYGTKNDGADITQFSLPYRTGATLSMGLFYRGMVNAGNTVSAWYQMPAILTTGRVNGDLMTYNSATDSWIRLPRATVAGLWSTTPATQNILGGGFRYTGLGAPTAPTDAARLQDIPSILTASASLNYPSIASNASSDLTITVTGAVVGDVVSVGVPDASVEPGTTFFGYVSNTNTVTVRCHNSSGSAVDPISGSFTVKVFK